MLKFTTRTKIAKLAFTRLAALPYEKTSEFCSYVLISCDREAGLITFKLLDGHAYSMLIQDIAAWEIECPEAGQHIFIETAIISKIKLPSKLEEVTITIAHNKLTVECGAYVSSIPMVAPAAYCQEQIVDNLTHLESHKGPFFEPAEPKEDFMLTGKYLTMLGKMFKNNVPTITHVAIGLLCEHKSTNQTCRCIITAVTESLEEEDF